MEVPHPFRMDNRPTLLAVTSPATAGAPRHAVRSGVLRVALKKRKQGILAADVRRCTPMQGAGLQTSDYSLDFDAWLAEVEQ
jgi:hypothetical protein